MTTANQKFIQHIFQQHKSARNNYRPDSLLILNHKFAFVEKLCPHVLVGGTNGKGSVTIILSNVLTQSGYRTGTFIGPHLLDYKERIRIDNQYISDHEFKRIYQTEIQTMVQWLKNNSEFSLSFFELMLLTAILYFNKKKVQAAVFEVGLGGKRDATACLSPVLSILTNVSLDHTHILGETISEIAAEKSGVIRPKATFIWAGQSELSDFFRQKCTEQQTFFQKPEKNDFLSNINSSLTEISGKLLWNQKLLTLQTKLKGFYQLQNIATVICACRQLQEIFTINEKGIQNGLAKSVHECRMETICNEPLIIVDGSHNFHGLQTLAEWIRVHLKDYQVFVALCIKANKQHALIQNIWPENVELLLYSGQEKKFLNGKGLRQNYPNGKLFPNYKTIYQSFFANDNPLKALIFTGSLYLAARQKRYFNKNHKKQTNKSLNDKKNHPQL